MDRKSLVMFPLCKRAHKLNINEIAVDPSSKPPELSKNLEKLLDRTVEKIVSARKSNSSVMLTYGAHLIKNGLAPVVNWLIEDGWITHIATNGAGSIHDWEFAYLGLSTESVRDNTARGCFGTWEETGRNINLAIALGGIDDLGYGESVGRMIGQDGYSIPSPEVLRHLLRQMADEDKITEKAAAIADMLQLISEFDLAPGWHNIEHQYKEYSVQYTAWQYNVPFTVHPGIGYDIIYTHPLNSGGAIGRGAVRDFLSYTNSVANLSGGVHLAVGSAVMAPMIFEKSLSMANNLSIKETNEPLKDYYLAVVDIQDGGDWDWTQGEPPMDHPAYYLRFCKSFYRMGGMLDYICLDNRAFMLNLVSRLRTVEF
ncbi:MAG: hypothetical protein SNJ70_05250 [Armatimonadota bacterium]